MNLEKCSEIDWIIEKSDYGFYLVTADEAVQREIVERYRNHSVGIFDYRKQGKPYAWPCLEQWALSMPKVQTFFIINLQYAVQTDSDLNRLNFSRDFLASLGKNLIFFTTPHGDDMLAKGAYDFYSYIKYKIVFDAETTEKDFLEPLHILGDEARRLGKDLDAKGKRETLWQTKEWRKEAKTAQEEGRYETSIRLWAYALGFMEELLGPNHLETAGVCHDLSEAYRASGRYAAARSLCEKALQIRLDVLGEAHPDVAESYSALAEICEGQGEYAKAEAAYQKALRIMKEGLGENSLRTARICRKLERYYEKQGKTKEDAQ